MVSSGKIDIEKFNGQSFELWKLKMEDLLVDKDQWITVDPERKGTSEGSVNLKLLIKERDLMMLLLQRRKPPQMKGGDVYLASSSTHVDHEAWLIDSGASFHFTRHREWFCEYEKYDGGDVLLGDGRKAKIIGRGKVKLKLQGGRVRTLPRVLHIPALARNRISISKLDDAGVKTVFEKDTCKMVREALVLMWGVRIGNLYKLQGSIVVDGYNSSMVPENGAENLVVSGEKPMLRHQRLGHIGEKGLRILHGKGMVEVDSEDGKLWKEAMVDEMASLHKNEAWYLVEFPAERKPIGSKWVFKKKTNAEGKVEKYKARLVAKDYSQVPGIDFGDIFSPVAKVTSIRLLLFAVAAFDFEVE
eukprot:PITA_34858